MAALLVLDYKQYFLYCRINALKGANISVYSLETLFTVNSLCVHISLISSLHSHNN